MKDNKKSLSKLGDKNPNWLGDKVGYGGLHRWVKKRMPQQKICEKCKKRETIDLANIGGIYNRDLKNWQWLCRHCHMKEDGRTEKLRLNSIGRIPWTKGRPRPLEVKIKISKSLTGRIGRKHTEETRARMSEIKRVWWKNRSLTN